MHFNETVILTDACGQVHTLNLHTTPGYPLAVHPGRNLVATGSTIHTAVMVWDLDRVETSSTPHIKVSHSTDAFIIIVVIRNFRVVTQTSCLQTKSSSVAERPRDCVCHRHLEM